MSASTLVKKINGGRDTLYCNNHSIALLLFAAKLMAELFLRLNLPVVLGELLAGMIIGPFALEAYLLYDGEPLLVIGSEIRVLGEIGAIVILFIAGLEMTPREFFKEGKAAFTVGAFGVVVPFFVGLLVFQQFGFDALQSMMIATALTATSIVISIQVLSEFGKIKTPEARLIIGSAVVDDILAISVLSVVSSIATGDGGRANQHHGCNNYHTAGIGILCNHANCRCSSNAKNSYH